MKTCKRGHTGPQHPTSGGCLACVALRNRAGGIDAHGIADIHGVLRFPQPSYLLTRDWRVRNLVVRRAQA